ncbi:FecCD family ABC transporter permease [Halovenus rubra]|uniref:Cobalamin import system permease protein BtuC n=2 Tax=Halovenus rubra TaxID=869890 RepID=A0ABD5X569_9EURY|nr:iron ABC transporter permease [Halovenus rubra]
MSNESSVGATAETGSRDKNRFVWLLDRRLLTTALGSVILVAIAGLLQVRYGAYSMTLGEVWAGIFNPNVIFNLDAWNSFLFGSELPEMSRDSLIIWELRLPRVLVAIIVGMNLAVSGAIFQAVTRNELASPFILGVSSGAGLMILLTLVVFSGITFAFGLPFLPYEIVFRPSSWLPLVAALGGAAAFLVVYLIAWKNGTSPVRLVLAGVIVGTVFNSMQTGLFFFADNIGVVQSAIAWTTGSLTGTGWEEVRLVLPWSFIAIILAVAGSRQCNVLLLGEETARSLGMSIEKVRFALSGVAVLAASASIAVAGIVSFIGLIVPHMVRNLVGSDYKKVIVGSLFVGPALMVTADVGARLGMGAILGADLQIPVGIVTGLIGGPYFLYLMRKQNNMGQI